MHTCFKLAVSPKLAANIIICETNLKFISQFRIKIGGLTVCAAQTDHLRPEQIDH